MSHQSYLTKKYFGSLDALRCISILAVIWHHAGCDEIFGWHFFSRGNQGVTLFFVISGFLITTLILRERDRTGGISLKDFYFRRTLRIFPLYYAVLALYVVVVFVMERNLEPGKMFFHNLPYYLTYTSNWFVSIEGERVIFYFAWSLATEEQFYLVWPWVEKFFRRSWMFVLIAALVLDNAIHFGWLAHLLPPLAATILSSVATPILLGVLLAHLLHDPKGFRWIGTWAGKPWMSIAAGFLAIGVLSIPTTNHWSKLFIDIGFFWLVASFVVNEKHFLAPLCRFRPVVWIGRISYGMYLFHMLCISFARRLPGLGEQSPVLHFLVGTVLVTIVASLSFLLFESYFLRLKERFR